MSTKQQQAAKGYAEVSEVGADCLKGMVSQGTSLNKACVRLYDKMRDAGYIHESCMVVLLGSIALLGAEYGHKEAALHFLRKVESELAS